MFVAILPVIADVIDPDIPDVKVFVIEAAELDEVMDAALPLTELPLIAAVDAADVELNGIKLSIVEAPFE